MTMILETNNEDHRNYACSRTVAEWKAAAIEELALAKHALREDRIVNAQGYLWRAMKFTDAAIIRSEQPEVQP